MDRFARQNEFVYFAKIPGVTPDLPPPQVLAHPKAPEFPPPPFNIDNDSIVVDQSALQSPGGKKNNKQEKQPKDEPEIKEEPKKDDEAQKAEGKDKNQPEGDKKKKKKKRCTIL